MSVVEFSQEELERAVGMDPTRFTPATPDNFDPVREGEIVAAQFHISYKLLMGQPKWGRLPIARRAYWKRLWELGWGYSDIAKFTGRHHSTIMYAIREETKTRSDRAHRARRLGVRGGVDKAETCHTDEP